MPVGLTRAAVHEARANGRAVSVSTRPVFGTWAGVLPARRVSAACRVANAAFVGRHDGTDRGRCSRKVRKTAAFSKDRDVHVAATWFGHSGDNFRRPVRAPRVRGDDGRWKARTPAMAAELTDHVWSIAEWMTFPVVQRQ